MKRSLLVIGLAVVLAGLGVAAVLYYVHQADARAVAGQKPVSVLVAAKRIPAGTTASAAQAAGLVHAETLPAQSVPADTLRAVDAEVGPLVASADIQPGQLVLRSAFAAEAPVSTSLPIPAGKVAVTVEFGLTQAVAGYLQAGSKIAVFDTYTASGADTGTPTGDGLPKQRGDVQVTRLLLSGVDVLAVAPASAEDGDGAKKSSSDSGPSTRVLLTMAVGQADAQRLILRAETGSLHLALLSADSKVSGAPGTSTTALFH